MNSGLMCEGVNAIRQAELLLYEQAFYARYSAQRSKVNLYCLVLRCHTNVTRMRGGLTE
jgi:hypothetical protein